MGKVNSGAMPDVAFFLKQLGGMVDKRGHERALLDGQRWREMPEPAAPLFTSDAVG
jgi:protein gp37